MHNAPKLRRRECVIVYNTPQEQLRKAIKITDRQWLKLLLKVTYFANIIFCLHYYSELKQTSENKWKAFESICFIFPNFLIWLLRTGILSFIESGGNEVYQNVN